MALDNIAALLLAALPVGSTLGSDCCTLTPTFKHDSSVVKIPWRLRSSISLGKQFT